MELRKVNLSPLKENDKLFKAYAFNSEILCWRDSEICTSECAAWRVHGAILNCMALPTNDQRIAQIIT
jgi:hypothetical protein